MARPKSEPQSGPKPSDQAGAATGAEPVPGGVPATGGAAKDSAASPDPDQDAREAADRFFRSRVDPAAMARPGIEQPEAPVLTPRELCEQLGVEPEAVFAINLLTFTVITRDGQKHRLDV